MNASTQTTDRFRVFVLALTLLNTIFAALLSGLQVDANIRADRSNRDSQYYALLAANEVIRFGHQSAYDLKLLATTVNQSQQALVMQLTALELEDAGKKESAAALVSQSEIAQARSDKGYALSLLYSDPRYAPAEPDGFPDQNAYLDDLGKAANEFVEKQNTASEEYHKWDNKADAYIAVLSILAIAFFLLGLAQSTTRMRLFFAISALAIMVLAAVWTGFIMIT
jgi:hypothetical protein